MTQQSLFTYEQNPPKVPKGFRYQSNFITADEEAELMRHIAQLSLSPYEYMEYEAKRKIKTFRKERGYPNFILPFLDRIAEFAKVNKETIEHILVTEYTPGTPMGWHRDMPPYDDVIGISLASPCLFRFRRQKGTKWERISLTLEPRSIYIMSGPSRSEWQHSIPPVTALRYSITLRTVR